MRNKSQDNPDCDENDALNDIQQIQGIETLVAHKMSKMSLTSDQQRPPSKLDATNHAVQQFQARIVDCRNQSIENILDYDNEMKVVKLKRKAKLSKEQQSAKSHSDSKKEGSMGNNVVNEGDEYSLVVLERTKSNKTPNKRLVGMGSLRENNRLLNASGMEHPSSNQHVLGVTEFNSEFDHTALTDSTINEGDHNSKRDLISDSQTPKSKASRSIDKNSASKPGHKRGRKKKEFAPKQNGENAMSHVNGSLALNQLSESRKRSIEKNNASLNPEKPHKPRGRPRKNPLPQGDDKSKIITTNNAVFRSANNAHQPSSYQQNHVNHRPLATQSEFVQHVVVQEHLTVNSQQPRPPVVVSNPQLYLTQQRSENCLNLLRECQTSVLLQNQRDDMDSMDENNPLNEELFGFESMQRIFSNEVTLRRRYSSIELSHHPINMMNEDDEEEEEEEEQKEITQEEHNESCDAHSELKIRIDIKNPSPTVETNSVPSKAGEEMVKRKRGRPRKYPLPGTANNQSASVSTTTENDSKNVKSPNKKTFSEMEISELDYHTGELNGNSIDSKDEMTPQQKKIKKVEFVRNQLSDSQDIGLQKTVISENISTVELPTLQTINS